METRHAPVGHEVGVSVGDVELVGDLILPERPVGIILFAHGSGSSRHSPRNRLVAETLNAAGFGTAGSLTTSSAFRTCCRPGGTTLIGEK
jgi:hypothetical protein